MYNAPRAPQSIGGVLDSGFSLFRAALADTFVLAFVGTLATAPLNLLARHAAASSPGVTPALMVLAALLPALVITVVIYGAIIARIDAVAQGRRISWSAALSVGCRRGPALAGVALCTAVVVVIGLCLLLVPGIFLAVALIFGTVAVVTEKSGPLESLRYSWELVRGHWWRTTGLLTVISIVAFVIYFIIGIIAGIGAAANPQAAIAQGLVPWYVDFVVGPLLSGVMSPLAYSLLMAAYNDLKLRREGGDIAERIAAAPV